jgi:hypothetical protein
MVILFLACFTVAYFSAARENQLTLTNYPSIIGTKQSVLTEILKPVMKGHAAMV